MVGGGGGGGGVCVCGGTYFPYIHVSITENFKNFLVRNHLTNFNIMCQKCSFGDHQDCSSHDDS